jgi:hypothetical protein
MRDDLVAGNGYPFAGESVRASRAFRRIRRRSIRDSGTSPLISMATRRDGRPGIRVSFAPTIIYTCRKERVRAKTTSRFGGRAPSLFPANRRFSWLASALIPFTWISQRDLELVSRLRLFESRQLGPPEMRVTPTPDDLRTKINGHFEK